MMASKLSTTGPATTLLAIVPSDAEYECLRAAAAPERVGRLAGVEGLMGVGGEHVDAVVLALNAGGTHPAGLAGEVRRVAPFAQIVFVGSAAAIARARQTLLLVGGLTEQWTFLKTEQPESWASALNEARGRAERRRSLRGSGPSSAPAAVVVPAPPELSSVQVTSVLNHMREAVLFLDLRGVITYANPAAAELYGLPTERLQGQGMSTLVAPECQEGHGQRLAELISGGTGGDWELTHRSADGRALTVEASLSPVRDWRGQLIGISVIVRDISERLAAAKAAVAEAEREVALAHAEELQTLNEELIAQQEELTQLNEELRSQNETIEAVVVQRTEELAEQRGLLEAMLEHLPAGVAFADADLVVQMVNPLFAKSYGRRPEDFIGKTFAGAFPEDAFPGLAARAEAPLRQVLETGQAWSNIAFPVQFRDADGNVEERFRDSTVVPVAGPDGAVRGLLSMSFDSTDRVRAEHEALRSAQALAAQTALTQRIIQHAPLVMAYLDRDLVYRWNNEVHSRFIGKPASEIVNRRHREVLPAVMADQVEQHYRQVLTTGEPLQIHAFPAQLAGQEALTYWDATYVPVLDEAGEAQGLMLIGVEVSDRVERERLQAETIEALKQSDRTKDEFLSVISHELRTPLNFIMGFASILEDEVSGSMNPPQRQAVGKILAGTDRMRLLVDDLLDYARMQAGTFGLDLEPTDVSLLVDDVAATMRVLAEQKALALEVDVAVDAPVPLDRDRVIQVLTNLVSNAIKFTDSGTVCIRARASGLEVLVEVIDTGCGIDADDVPRLFQRFQQLDMSNTRRAGGVGLGLAISKAIIEAHGGVIGVESRPGEGSTFWFRLPLDRAGRP